MKSGCVPAFIRCVGSCFSQVLNGGGCKCLNVSRLFFLQFLSYHCVHSDEHQETKSFFQANRTGAVDLDERALQRPLSCGSNTFDLCQCLVSHCCIVCSCVARIARLAPLNSSCVFVCVCQTNQSVCSRNGKRGIRTIGWEIAVAQR